MSTAVVAPLTALPQLLTAAGIALPPWLGLVVVVAIILGIGALASTRELWGRPAVAIIHSTARFVGAWTAARSRLWLTALAIAVWLPLLGMPFRRWLDFSAFWVGAQFAFTAQLLDLGSVTVRQQQLGLPIAPFVYPPEVALAYLPLGALPYDVAAAVNVVVMTAALVAAAALGADLLGVRRRWAILATLAWPPAAAAVVSGQNTSLALLLIVAAAIALRARRDFLGGMAAGVLAYKPQVGLPFGLGLAIRRAWLSVAGVTAVLVIHYLLGVLATGGKMAWPFDWLALVRDPSWVRADLAENGWQAISLPSLMARSAVVYQGAPSLELVGYLLGAAIAIPCVRALRHWSDAASVGLIASLVLVVSPHAWVYDATLLLPALGVFAADANRRGWPPRDRWMVAAAYGVAAMWPLGVILGMDPLLAVVVAAPLVLVRSHGATS